MKPDKSDFVIYVLAVLIGVGAMFLTVGGWSTPTFLGCLFGGFVGIAGSKWVFRSRLK